MENRKKNLEVEYAGLSTELNINGEPDAISDLIQERVADVDTMEQKWQAEKEALLE